MAWSMNIDWSAVIFTHLARSMVPTRLRSGS